MNVLFYRYGSICEPDVIDCFRQAGLTVTEEKSRISGQGTSDQEMVASVSALLEKERFLFVFSINFFPALSDVCNIFGVPYVCWTVDCPVMELFSNSLSNPCNRVFLFDRAQYDFFRKRTQAPLFYLPLATNPDRLDRVIEGATHDTRTRFSSDVSFVGSLYGEKNSFRKIEGLDEYTTGYLDALAEAQLLVYGYNFLEESLPPRVPQDVIHTVPAVETRLFGAGETALRHYIAHAMLGYELAERERKRLLNALGERFAVDLYTQSDTSSLSGINIKGSVNSLTEMPLVFHESRINLNITMRAIQTGLSLRVFDICGCGGFLLTNFQAELADFYEPGVEAEYFTSREELTDKCAWYLAHEEERKRIAQRGYERTKVEHTYAHRMEEMIRKITETL